MSLIRRFQAWRMRRAAKRREARILKNCGCVCYCPHCREPLNDQATILKAGAFDHIVEYRCNWCGRESCWNFGAPVPIHIKP